MQIKDIDYLIHGGPPLRRLKTPIYDKVTKAKPASKPNPSSTLMKDVVPPLSQGDFLNCWKEDRAQLEKIKSEKDKIVKENKKLKKVMQTTWSKDWPAKVSEILKEDNNDKKT